MQGPLQNREKNSEEKMERDCTAFPIALDGTYDTEKFVLEKSNGQNAVVHFSPPSPTFFSSFSFTIFFFFSFFFIFLSRRDVAQL